MASKGDRSMSDCWFSHDISEILSCCKDGNFDDYGFPINVCPEFPCLKYKGLSEDTK